MAFFDDLSKKITDASTKTIQKGKDLTDVARLNSQISAEENRINTLYGMIGKQYMELHRKDAEDAFAGLVASVAEAEQNIAACRAKITELRAVPHCPNCGAELVKGAAFCGICGTTHPRCPGPCAGGCARPAAACPGRPGGPGTRCPGGGTDDSGAVRTCGSGCQILPQLRRENARRCAVLRRVRHPLLS